jgi:hypothetical protein
MASSPSTYVTHYYLRGTPPCRSLSALQDEHAISLMKDLCDDSIFGARFRDPVGYLARRRRSERWVHDEFIKKGGLPKQDFPIYFVFGESRWLVQQSPDRQRHAELRIPIDVFDEADISFTYPDSMISLWLSLEKPRGLYLQQYHGIVFTRDEILAIVREKGDPEKDWQSNLPPTLAPYIEAQVWNVAPLEDYIP